MIIYNLSTNIYYLMTNHLVTELKRATYVGVNVHGQNLILQLQNTSMASYLVTSITPYIIYMHVRYQVILN